MIKDETLGRPTQVTALNTTNADSPHRLKEPVLIHENLEQLQPTIPVQKQVLLTPHQVVKIQSLQTEPSVAQTQFNEYAAPLKIAAPAQLDLLTGLASMFRLAFATSDHMMRQSSRRNYANSIFVGGTLKNRR
jgi:hypothetical protein